MPALAVRFGPSSVAASFQLVRELTEPLPTQPPLAFFPGCTCHAAGPAEVSFAGNFAAGSEAAAGVVGAKFQRSSSFSRSRLAVCLFRGGKFLTCPGVDGAPPYRPLPGGISSGPIRGT